MADGDEKIDHNDRVFVMNRVQDARIEVQFNGVIVTWKPGETRSIQRVEAYEHYVRKSLIFADPTGDTFPVEALVIVNEAKEPLEPGASTSPLTGAECREMSKNGKIDTSKLPPDRLLGGMILIDPETGQYPGKVELRRDASDPRGTNVPPLVKPMNRGALDAALDDVDRAPA